MGDIVGTRTTRHALTPGSRGRASIPALVADAQYHADRLAKKKSGSVCGITHSSEIGAWYRGHCTRAENVGCIWPCPSNGTGFHNGWMNSPSHRANILDGEYTFVGVGIACNGRAMFAVVHFRS